MTEETMTMTQPDTAGTTGNAPEGNEDIINAAQLMDEPADEPGAQQDDAPPWTADEPEGEYTDEEDYAEQDGGEAPAQSGLPDEAQCRQALQELLESGFTMEELRAFSQDAAAQMAIVTGASVARAATDFLRRSSARAAAPVKRGVPTVRTAAAGERREGNIIEQMSDAQFRAFSRRAREAALEGRRVRLD